MSGFSVDWLSLREAADRRARNRDLLQAVGRHFDGWTQITVTDIGCGTGSAMRAFAEILPARQSWRLVDRDTALLAAVTPPRPAAEPAVLEIDWHLHATDLHEDIEEVVALPSELVVMSALLDIMPDAWLQRFADALAAARRPVHAALTYDGRAACDPPDPMDAMILEAFNAHQRSDKGRGADLGPDAASATASALRTRGYVVHEATADWQLGPADRGLQHAIVQGWSDAVGALGVVDPAEIKAWHTRRSAAIDAGVSSLTVGHTDIWAYPAE